MTRPEATDAWIAAMADGWIDTKRLKFLVPESDCGIEGCRYKARFIDPCGVGWCGRHKNQGMSDCPDFETLVWP